MLTLKIFAATLIGSFALVTATQAACVDKPAIVQVALPSGAVLLGSSPVIEVVAAGLRCDVIGGASPKLVWARW